MNRVRISHEDPADGQVVTLNAYKRPEDTQWTCEVTAQFDDRTSVYRADDDDGLFSDLPAQFAAHTGKPIEQMRPHGVKIRPGRGG